VNIVALLQASKVLFLDKENFVLHLGDILLFDILPDESVNLWIQLKEFEPSLLSDKVACAVTLALVIK